MKYLTFFLRWWHLAIAGLAASVALFYRWQAGRKGRQAERAKDRVKYLEAKEEHRKLQAFGQDMVREKHLGERERLAERRERGERRDLGRW